MSDWVNIFIGPCAFFGLWMALVANVRADELKKRIEELEKKVGKK